MYTSSTTVKTTKHKICRFRRESNFLQNLLLWKSANQMYEGVNKPELLPNGGKSDPNGVEACYADLQAKEEARKQHQAAARSLGLVGTRGAELLGTAVGAVGTAGIAADAPMGDAPMVGLAGLCSSRSNAGQRSVGCRCRRARSWHAPLSAHARHPPRT